MRVRFKKGGVVQGDGSHFGEGDQGIDLLRVELLVGFAVGDAYRADHLGAGFQRDLQHGLDPVGLHRIGVAGFPGAVIVNGRRFAGPADQPDDPAGSGNFPADILRVESYAMRPPKNLPFRFQQINEAMFGSNQPCRVCYNGG